MFNRKRNLEEIAYSWVNGAKIDWKQFYKNTSLLKIDFPKYPFSRSRFWLQNKSRDISKENTFNIINKISCENEDKTKFKVNFHANDLYIKEHVVNGEQIVPATAYLDIIRYAVQQTTKRTVVGLEDVIWIDPLDIKEIIRKPIFL
ncbi:hypothetical protein AAHB54_13350 [Bacillus cereus]